MDMYIKTPVAWYVHQNPSCMVRTLLGLPATMLALLLMRGATHACRIRACLCLRSLRNLKAPTPKGRKLQNLNRSSIQAFDVTYSSEELRVTSRSQMISKHGVVHFARTLALRKSLHGRTRRRSMSGRPPGVCGSQDLRGSCLGVFRLRTVDFGLRCPEI